MPEAEPEEAAPAPPPPEVKAAPIRLQKPETKAPPPPHRAHAAAQAEAPTKSKIEFLPWKELSAGQKAGRVVAAGLALLVVFYAVRWTIRSLHFKRGGLISISAGQSQVQPAALSAAERKDGVQSLCKVFNIYGMPKSDSDAFDDAKNAGELFKLAGNETPERSAYILSTMVKEFEAGKLTPNDCTAAGVPLDTSESNVPAFALPSQPAGGQAVAAPKQ